MEINNEPHINESVGTPHPVQHYCCWLFSVRTDTNCTAYGGNSYSNGHLCTNTHTTSYIQTAPNIYTIPDIHINCRSYLNLDTCGNVSRHQCRE